MSGMPLLSLAIWVPIFAGLIVLLTGSDRNAPLARGLALVLVSSCQSAYPNRIDFRPVQRLLLMRSGQSAYPNRIDWQLV